jgi:hypothetical protein
LLLQGEKYITDPVTERMKNMEEYIQEVREKK